MIKASKITHKNETRIRVDFPYNQELVSKLRQIPDARWSKTLRSWHIPYLKEAFVQLKSLFPDIEYETNPIILVNPTPTPIEPNAIDEKQPLPGSKKKLDDKKISSKPITDDQYKTEIRLGSEAVAPQSTEKTKPAEHIEVQAKEVAPQAKMSIEIVITRSLITITLAKNEADILFLRSFKYAKWDFDNFCWVLPNYGTNVEKLKRYFQDRDVIFRELEQNRVTDGSKLPEFTKNELLVINDSNRKLKVCFVYNQAMVDQLKFMGYVRWNAYDRCWDVPYNDKCMAELKLIAQRNDREYRYVMIDKLHVKPRIPRSSFENYRHCPTEYIAKLKELRYSQNTLDTYKHMFEEFINYYNDTEIDDITDEMIIAFLRYLVNERNISGSYQNQSINSIHPVGF